MKTREYSSSMRTTRFHSSGGLQSPPPTHLTQPPVQTFPGDRLPLDPGPLEADPLEANPPGFWSYGKPTPTPVNR